MISLERIIEDAEKLEHELRFKFGEFNHYTMGVRSIRRDLEKYKEEVHARK